ncbi:MAG: hypothetical protein HRU34_15950 [Richelia sp.]|nr:hypothetical protein [Richelia sp.]
MQIPFDGCLNEPINPKGVAESGDDFTKFSRIYQCFQMLIHPALMQRHPKVFEQWFRPWVE